MSRGSGAAHWRAELSLALVTLVWGATFVVVKAALAEVSALLFLALRFSLAAAVLLALFRGRALFGPGAGAAWRAGIPAGLCLFSGYAFQTFGLYFNSPSKSAFLTGMSTVLVPLLGALIYRRNPGISEAAGVAVAAVGMGLLTLERMEPRMGPGDMLTLGCAVMFALHILVIGHYARRVSFEALSLIQVATAAVCGSMTFFWWEPYFIRWTPAAILAIVITGVLGTALAFSIQSYAQRHTTATRTGLIFALEPVFAWVTSFLITGETLGIRQTSGAALILAGIAVVELKPFRPADRESGLPL
ncbi:MAG: DMT family transporter [Bryobacterales bacterium]|nr:DMT family transporter [Bryobacterales bacterium]